MSEPASGPGVPAPTGRSNFDVALAMFLKRKRAVAAGAVLALLFLAAIWTPLLATSAPLHFRGADKGAITQAARVARLELQDLARAFDGKESWNRGKAEASFAVVEFQLARMERSLSEGVAAKVRAVRDDVARHRAAPDPASADVPLAMDPERAKALEALAATVKNDLRPTEADLVVRTAPGLLVGEARAGPPVLADAGSPAPPTAITTAPSRRPSSPRQHSLASTRPMPTATARSVSRNAGRHASRCASTIAAAALSATPAER